MKYARNWAVRPSRVAGFVALVVGGVALAGVVAAAPITIVNFGFEDPVRADGLFTNGTATGWVVTGFSGVFNPTVAQLSQGPTQLLQVGYSNTSGGGFSQTLGAVLTANTLYTLQVDVESRTDGPVNDHTGSTLQLRTAVQNDLLATSFVGPLAGGTNFLLTTSFLADILNPNLGETLKIVLLSSGSQSDWDNVRLDATDVTAVPEPTTLLLWGTTAAGLAAAWRRLRGRSLA